MTALHKSTLLEAMNDLPDETSVEAAIEKLYLVSKIKKGIDQVEAGQTLSHTDVKSRFSQWLQ